MNFETKNLKGAYFWLDIFCNEYECKGKTEFDFSLMLLVTNVNLEMQTNGINSIFSAKRGQIHSDVTVDGRTSANQGVLNYLDIYFPSSTIFTNHCKWSTKVSISTAHPRISCINMIAHGNATIREHLQQASFCCLDDAPVGVERYQDFGAEKTLYYWDLWGVKFFADSYLSPFTSLNLV